jgi:hypothetical protein
MGSHERRRARAHEARSAVIKEHVHDRVPLVEHQDAPPSLFDPPAPPPPPPPEPTATEAQAQRELGIARAALGADPEWMEEAWAFLVEYLSTHAELFVDDLWSAGLPHTTEDRALGSLFLRASRQGLMRKTGSYRPSKRSNMTDKPVWESLMQIREA